MTALDEDTAEAELSAAIAAAAAAPASEEIAGLGDGTAILHFPVAGALGPQYREGRRDGEQPLVFLYLAIRGLGETPRLMLAEAGATYEHLASPMGEDQSIAAEWRRRSPNGLTPIMSGLGVPRATPLCQSSAIVRYLAGRYGMDGGDELARARADSLFETARDLRGKGAEVRAGEYETAGAKGAVLMAENLLKMLAGMGDVKDASAALNYGQIQLLNVLLEFDEDVPGCVERLSPQLDAWRKAGAGRKGIAAYLRSGMRFPKVDAAYRYKTEAIKRGDLKR